jgi:TonB dependent receptor
LATDTSLGFLPDTPVGGINITGITPFVGGIGAAGENDFHYTSWQFYDDVFYTRNAHFLEFGITLERIESNKAGNDNPNGGYNFGSLKAFLTNQPQSFTSTILGKNPTIYLRQSVPRIYAHDEYRVRPNLILNLGVRYEMATVPTEKYNLLSNLESLMATTLRLGSPYFQNPTLRDFSPRTGFAWDPFRNGKTAVRGGFGIYDTSTADVPVRVARAQRWRPIFRPHQSPHCRRGRSRAPLPLLTPDNLGYAWVQPNPKRSYCGRVEFRRAAPIGRRYLGHPRLHGSARTAPAAANQ